MMLTSPVYLHVYIRISITHSCHELSRDYPLEYPTECGTYKAYEDLKLHGPDVPLCATTGLAVLSWWPNGGRKVREEK